MRILLLAALLALPGWSLDVVSGSDTVPTSSTKDIATGSIDANLVEIWWTRDTADGDADDLQMGYGVLTTSEQLAIYGRQTDGTLNADGFQDTASCIATINSSGTILEQFSCAFGAGGTHKFVLTTVTGSTAFKFFFKARRVTAAKLVPFQINNTGADQNITGAGFSPDVTLFITAGLETTDVTNFATTQFRPGFGVAVDATHEIGLGLIENTAVTTERSAQSTTKSIYIPGGAAMLLEGDIKTVGADGVTIQWTTVGPNAIAGWLLFIDGVQAAVGSFNQTNGAGDSTITGIGFTQEEIGLMSFCLASASGQQTDGRMALGMATGTTNEAGLSVAAVSGNQNADRAFDSDESIMCYTAGTAGLRTLNAKGNVSAWSAGGFTITWTTADATLRQVIYWAMGDEIGTARRRLIQIQ